MRKPRGYWTKEKCIEEGLKYDTITQFSIAACHVYEECLKNRWMIEFTHFKKATSNLYWTENKVRDIASRYTDYKKFYTEQRNVYSAAIRLGVMEDVCSHMIRTKAKQGYWTKEKLQEEALKYKTRSEFGKYNISAYTTASRRGITDEICSHMLPCGDLFKRMVYAYVFTDNMSYVGLTVNIDSRHWQHMSTEQSPVYQHMKSTGLTPYLIKISSPLPAQDAMKLESDTIDKCKKLGYKILNKKKAGGLGGGENRRKLNKYL